jgi:hypothetical protein
MLNELLKDMQNVRVSAPTYQDLVSLYYMEKILLIEKDLSTEEKFLIFKNFCEIYKSINSNEDVISLMKRVNNFRKDLKVNGIRVEDLKNNVFRKCRPLFLSILLALLKTFILIPFFIFFLPIRSILISIAERKRIQAKKNSVVKGKITIYKFNKKLEDMMSLPPIRFFILCSLLLSC